MFSLNTVTKNMGLNLLPLVLETRMLSQHQQETGNRQDLEIDPNLRFSELLGSLNSLNSLNIRSIQGKTPLSC